MRVAAIAAEVIGWLLVLFIAMLVMARIARAQSGHHGDGHAQHHEEYRHWRQPDTGGSCCNDADCRPTRSYRDDQDRWHAWNGDRWIVVPDSKVLTLRASDGRSHLCESGGTVYCLVPAEPKS